MSVVRETAESLLTAIPPLNIAVRGMKMDQENARLPHDFSNQNDEDKGLLQQVLEKGYVVLPSYFDAGWCEACRNAVDTVIEKHPDYVRVREDERLFGSQNINKQLKEFHDDPRLKKLADAYVGEEAVVGVSMANRLGCVPGQTLGSGGDWHRDRMTRQIKSITYLDDVGPNDGPFEYIAASNTYNAENFRKDSKITGLPNPATRFTNKDVQRLIDKQPERLITFTAPKGTVILVDTSGLHRGSPLGQGGKRYAVFNYYYEVRDIDWKALEKKFSPIIPEGFKI